MPDAADDVDEFLRAIYLPGYIHRHGHPTSGVPCWSGFPGMYEGILRLAKKYDAPGIQKAITAAVKNEWPPTLRSWDVRQDQAEEDAKSAANAGLPLSSVVYPNPARTVRIANDYGIPEVLPVAYYDLYQVYKLKKVRTDTVQLDALTSDEKDVLILGMASMNKHVVEELCHPSLPPHQADVHLGKLEEQFSSDGIVPCMEPLLRWWGLQFDRILESADPLRGLKVAEETVMLSSGLGARWEVDAACFSCRDHIRETIHDMRHELWKKLPALFDLMASVGHNWGA
ncbi:hypothetical protein OF83DRAFT_1177102 [Amylostereum chailletii]|nr:hypothetical protein OF83DRAFT_1177102 [Amylostereum chailletii]